MTHLTSLAELSKSFLTMAIHIQLQEKELPYVVEVIKHRMDMPSRHHFATYEDAAAYIADQVGEAVREKEHWTR